MEELIGLHAQPLSGLYLHSTVDLITEGLVPLWVTAVSHCPCLRGARRSCGQPQLDITVGFGHCRGGGRGLLMLKRFSGGGWAWKQRSRSIGGYLPGAGLGALVFPALPWPGIPPTQLTRNPAAAAAVQRVTKQHRSLSNSLKLPDSGSKILCPV